MYIFRHAHIQMCFRHTVSLSLQLLTTRQYSCEILELSNPSENWICAQKHNHNNSTSKGNKLHCLLLSLEGLQTGNCCISECLHDRSATLPFIRCRVFCSSMPAVCKDKQRPVTCDKLKFSLPACSDERNR